MERILKVRSIAAIMIAAGASLLATGCGKSGSSASAAGPGQGQRAAAPVVISTVEQRDIPVQITGIGNVAPYQMVQIRSQVNGQISAVHFKEGDDVHRGQLLFSLDKSAFEADLQRTMGQMKKDQAVAAN